MVVSRASVSSLYHHLPPPDTGDCNARLGSSLVLPDYPEIPGDRLPTIPARTHRFSPAMPLCRICAGSYKYGTVIVYVANVRRRFYDGRTTRDQPGAAWPRVCATAFVYDLCSTLCVENQVAAAISGNVSSTWALRGASANINATRGIRKILTAHGCFSRVG